jgi:hypothetical protein
MLRTYNMASTKHPTSPVYDIESTPIIPFMCHPKDLNALRKRVLDIYGEEDEASSDEIEIKLKRKIASTSSTCSDAKRPHI